MPCLAFAYNPAVGPLIQVAIFSFNFRPPPIVPNQAPMALKLYSALIDTGASCTCVSQQVVSDLNLSPIGKQPVGGVHGTKAANQYQFQVGIVFGHQQINPTGSANTNFAVHPTVGVEFIPTSGVFDVLLGRDVICRGSLQLSFDGHGILSL